MPGLEDVVNTRAPQAEAPTAAQGEPAPTTPLNLHDPQARLQRKRGERAEFRYHASFSADVATGLITDAVANEIEEAGFEELAADERSRKLAFGDCEFRHVEADA
jgi:hypothetical protein